MAGSGVCERRELVIAKAVEADPLHVEQLRKALLDGLAEAGLDRSAREQRGLELLLSDATQTLDIVPWRRRDGEAGGFATR